MQSETGGAQLLAQWGPRACSLLISLLELLRDLNGERMHQPIHAKPGRQLSSQQLANRHHLPHSLEFFEAQDCA